MYFNSTLPTYRISTSVLENGHTTSYGLKHLFLVLFFSAKTQHDFDSNFESQMTHLAAEALIAFNLFPYNSWIIGLSNENKAGSTFN